MHSMNSKPLSPETEWVSASSGIHPALAAQRLSRDDHRICVFSPFQDCCPDLPLFSGRDHARDLTDAVAGRRGIWDWAFASIHRTNILAKGQTRRT